MLPLLTHDTMLSFSLPPCVTRESSALLRTDNRMDTSTVQRCHQRRNERPTRPDRGRPPCVFLFLLKRVFLGHDSDGGAGLPDQWQWSCHLGGKRQAGNQTNHRPATVAVAVSTEKNKRRGGARAPGPGLERFSAPTPLSVPFIGSVGEAAFRRRPSTVRDAMATLFQDGNWEGTAWGEGAGQWGCRRAGGTAGAWHG